MPLLTRTFIKTAMVCLALALVLGILLAGGVTNGLFPVYIHLLVFGWLTQLIFGVVFWMFPKYSNELPRGHESLGWITYAALNIGLILRAIAEPTQATQPNNLYDGLLIASAILQWLAGVAFIANTWRRIKEK
jgi:hypothetical protein